MPTALEIGKDLRDLRETQAKFFNDHKAEDGSLVLTAEQVAEARKRNDDITAKAKSLEDAQDAENMAAGNEAELKRFSQPTGRLTRPVIEPIDGDGGPISAKTLGELFTASPAYREFIGSGKPSGPSAKSFELDLEQQYGKAVAAKGIKAVFDIAAWAPQAVRLPEPVIPGFERMSVASLMPEGRTAQNSIAYMEETTTTNAAAEVAESAVKPESALALTEKTSAVRKVATHLPITDESLEDVPMVESYIDTRLRTFVQLRENQQLLVGNGTAPNLRGLLNVVGIQTQAKGADPVPDAIYKAMTKIRTIAFLEPTGAVFNPNDWQDVRLLRTADGVYIWGNPSEAGPERIWGLETRITTAITENTGLVGAFRVGAQIFRRAEITVQVGWINDQFVRNQRTILAEERLALVPFRPTAFCTVTGI